MKQKTLELLRQKGYQPIFEAINKSIRDLRQAQYTRGEIKETLNELFSVDNRIRDYIKELGY